MRRYGQQHLESEVARLLARSIPLSGLVLDFAWHDYGWQGGYDWSPLVPHPRELIDWLHARGVKLSLNDHPGYANTEESSRFVQRQSCAGGAAGTRTADAAGAVLRPESGGKLEVRP